MCEILDTIDGALTRQETVYVHCWGGHGRTGTVVGCWLVRRGHSPKQAISQIHEWRRRPAFAQKPPSPETPDQHAFIQTWRKGV